MKSAGEEGLHAVVCSSEVCNTDVCLLLHLIATGLFFPVFEPVHRIMLCDYGYVWCFWILEGGQVPAGFGARTDVFVFKTWVGTWECNDCDLSWWHCPRLCEDVQMRVGDRYSK